jgi:hypothetical protein
LSTTPRIDNPEKRATLYTYDTGRRQAKQKTQNDEQHGPHHTLEVNSGSREGKVLPASYKTPAMLLI